MKLRGMLLTVIAFTAAACASLPHAGAREAVLELDARQRELVAAADAEGLAALAHRDLLINSPNGQVLTRDAFLTRIANGEIGAEAFTRDPEEVRITGDVAMVMGRETFTPTAQSELGRRYGAVPLQRRYTNVYRFEGGRWLWWARHANVVGE